LFAARDRSVQHRAKVASGMGDHSGHWTTRRQCQFLTQQRPSLKVLQPEADGTGTWGRPCSRGSSD
jgi:hypothetical protein